MMISQLLLVHKYNSPSSGNYQTMLILIGKCQGEHDVSDRYETATHISKAIVREIEKHPRFYIRRALGVIKYDIALLTLEQPVDFSRFSHIRKANCTKGDIKGGFLGPSAFPMMMIWAL